MAVIRIRPTYLSMLLALATGGCASHSAKQVSGSSIVSRSVGYNVVQDPSFTAPGLGPWHTVNPRGGTTDRIVVSPGSTAVAMKISPRAREGTQFLYQLASPPTPGAAGATYTLRLRVRTLHLREPIISQFRVTYMDGTYQFFGQTTPATDSGTTSADWIPVVVTGKIRGPVSSLDIFPLDTAGGKRPGGTIWATDIELRYAGPAS